MWNPFSPCAFGHSRHWHNGPMVDGRRPKHCDRCLQPIGWVCEGEMLTEPLPQVVAGVPTGKAKLDDRKPEAPRKLPDNVRELRQSSK